ncbi:ribonuclease J [Candidatus Peregrinibacteria bacterium CG11_big_fil_rev_8_21_14_0_20_46_8]|nr:MAG: ribonuclease J [Candidatus Peregrinibacteria bacterium CG11_big_fil_rev_8_21_14_0_20_46_8]
MTNNGLDGWLQKTLEGTQAQKSSSGEPQKKSRGGQRQKRRRPRGPKTPHSKTTERQRTDQNLVVKMSQRGRRGGRMPTPKSRLAQKPAPKRADGAPKPGLRAIPLGGLDEVGKNMMLFEYGNDIVIVDMGFQFPEEDMLGIDYVIPDISYLRGKEKKIRGILITHGHLDHIGAIPYLLPQLGFPPIYASRLTLGLVKERLKEFHLESKATVHEIDPEKTIDLGVFKAEWFAVNHSIPDSFGIILHTPEGICVHTGDFKFDFNPVFQHRTNFNKIAELGSKNVLALFSDSTNAVRAGHTTSEKKIGETLEGIIRDAEGRIIIAVFSSSIGRVQSIVNFAEKYGRKVYLSGRSMDNNVSIAQHLGFLKAPAGLIQDIKRMGKVKDEDCLILTTGAQGEPMSALSRMGHGAHSQITLKENDTIILSSSPIPGNERSIFTVINNITRLGARVIFNKIADVHTSGHASREDLKLMIDLVKPKYLVPVHGELYMRQAHAEIGQKLGMPKTHTILLENGDIFHAHKGAAEKSKDKVSANYIMIDGKGIGDVGEQIIMDRQTMAENGFMVVLFTVHKKSRRLQRDPELVSRGFIHMKEAPELVKEIVTVARKHYDEAVRQMPGARRGEIKAYIRSCLDRFSHKKIERHPLIIPIVVEA